jgi:predicted dehydrogenase
MTSDAPSKTSSSSITRRRFLHTTGAVAATGAASAGGSPISRALLATGVLGANERIGLGLIGCGGRGNSLMQDLLKLKEKGTPVDIVAVCDIYRPRLDKAAKAYGAKPYMRHQDLLADQRVDVVCIATPDHHHAPQVLDAAKAGKDAYCEKPLSHWSQFELTKRMVKVVEQNKRIVQVGTQYMSDSAWHQGAELVKAGEIGQPIHAECGYFRVGDWGERGMPIDDPNAKPGKDLLWDVFLGDRPKRPFDVSRFFRWRMYEDYSGGPVTDLYPHVLTPVVSVLDAKMPAMAVATGGKFRYQEREVPDTFNMIVDYPEKFSIAVLGTQGNDYPTGDKRRYGVPYPLFRGWDGTLTVEGNDLVVVPNGGAQKPTKRIPIAFGVDQQRYWQNFLDCCRSRRQPWGHLGLAYRVQTALQMAMLAFRNGKTARFDATSEQIVI